MTAPRKITNMKLSTVPKKELVELAKNQRVAHKNGKKDANAAEIISRLVKQNDSNAIDKFIREKYREKVKARQSDIISDSDLLAELDKVTEITWGAEQGRLDDNIQRQYVRQTPRFDDLIAKISSAFQETAKGYAIASWYNHWSTELIENCIGLHPNVVPTLKPKKGVDLFLNDEPLDLKVTYLPRKYPGSPRAKKDPDPVKSADQAIKDKMDLARWLYRNQGEQRFGDDQRLYIVLIDKNDPSQSWKMKRNIQLLYPKIDHFLNTEKVDENDDLTFVYNKKSHFTRCKILLIDQ